MDISIIIVSWNVKDLLKKCIESIYRFSEISPPARGGDKGEVGDFEVVVVDNASADGTIDMVRDNFHQVKLIVNKENLGFAKANNQGIKEATGDYILLLNPDTEFIEDSLSKVIQKIDSDEKIGVLGCKLLNPDKSIQPSVRRFPTVLSQLVILFKLQKLFPSLLNKYLAKDFWAKGPPVSGWDYGVNSSVKPHPSSAKATAGRPNPLLGKERELIDVDQVMGAFFCIRRELIEKIGMLDEGYFIWFEEVDFCKRAKKAGYKVVYYPGTNIIHHGGQSFEQQMTIKKQFWFFKSALRYFLKH